MTNNLTEINVVGKDKTGLIAQITSLLFERGINIEDLDQAVRDGVFRMTMHVDTSEMVCTKETLREALYDLGEELNVDIRVRFPDDKEIKGIAVLVTKEQHCLKKLLEIQSEGNLEAEIRVIIGNYDDLEHIAEAYGIPFFDIGGDNGQPDEDKLLDVLEEYNIDLVILARYMRILSPDIVFRYEGRIINIHPSLLPSFPGAQAYRQAIEEGVRITGVTAHYVTTDLDQGPIITQRAFNVPDEASPETLKEKGKPLESKALLEAIRIHLNDDITIHRGRTELRDGENKYQLGMPEKINKQIVSKSIDD